MNKLWHYTMDGTGANGSTWAAEGMVGAPDLMTVIHAAARDAFEQITNGTARYGEPGTSCNGPYDILKVTLTQVRKQ